MALFFVASHRVGRVVDTLCASAATRGWGLAAALSLCLSVCPAPRAADAGTLVNFNTQFGTIQIDLFDDLVPDTVDNFLSYANSGAYTDVLVHRSTSIADSGIAVIQGGGFTFSESGSPFVRIPTASPIALESPRANTRGTIAMARTLDDLNTATSQWFINAVDNSQGLAPGSAGGFAVFGWVVGNGMSVVETINAFPKTSVPNPPFQPFTNVPVQNAGNPIQQSNMVFTDSVTVVGTHPSFQNPFNSADVRNDGLLRASDVHAVINDLLANGLHAVEGPFSGTNYLDANGSGTITAADVHSVINALLSQNSAAPLAAPMAAPLAAPMFTVAPEPTSLSLGAIAALTLAAGALWRRRRLAAARPGR